MYVPSGRIYISKDVIFNESKFPYADLFETSPSLSRSTSSSIPIIQSPNPSHPTSNSPQPTQTHTSVSGHLNPDVVQSESVSAQSSSTHQPAQSDTDTPIPASSPVQSSNTEPTDQSLPVTVASVPAISSEATSSTINPTSPQRPPNTHPMQTRSKSGIHLPRINPTLLQAHCEPKSVKQALTDPNWLLVMRQEYEASMRNHTWDLVPLPPDRQPIGCKWVFQVKENADASINKYRARLVAKNFNQVAAFDFS